MGTRVATVRSWGAYGEFRRLTILGEDRLRVRTQRSLALASSSAFQLRLATIGFAGGKSS